MRSRAVGFLLGLGLFFLVGHAFANNPTAVFLINFTDQDSDCPSIFDLSVSGATCNSTTITGSGTMSCTYEPNPQTGGPALSLTLSATPGVSQHVPAVFTSSYPVCSSNNTPVFRLSNNFNNPIGGMLTTLANQSTAYPSSGPSAAIFAASPTVHPYDNTNLCTAMRAAIASWNGGHGWEDLQNDAKGTIFQVDLSGPNQAEIANWVKNDLHCIPTSIYLSCPSIIPSRIAFTPANAQKYFSVRTNITSDNLGLNSKQVSAAYSKCVQAPHSVVGPNYQAQGVGYYTTTQAFREGINNDPNLESAGACAAIFVPGQSLLARTLIDGFSQSCSNAGFLNSTSTVNHIIRRLHFTTATFNINCKLNQGALSCDGPTLAD